MKAEFIEQPGFPVPQFRIIAETSEERETMRAVLEYPIRYPVWVEFRTPISDQYGPLAFNVGYLKRPQGIFGALKTAIFSLQWFASRKA